MFPDTTFYFYVLLSATDIVLLLWTMVLIARTAFLTNHQEAQWMRQGRRISLALVIVGLAMATRWHIEHHRSAWLPEYFLLSGIGLYMSIAIISSYERLRRLGIHLS